MPAPHQAAAPGLAEHVDGGEQARHPAGERDPQRIELLGPPAQAQPQNQAAARDQVHHGGVLGQPGGFVERGQQQRSADPDAPGSGGDRRAHGQQRWQVGVVDEVVLGHPHRVEAERVRVLGERQGLLVEVLVGPGIAWVALAGDEAEPEVHTHRAGSATGERLARNSR